MKKILCIGSVTTDIIVSPVDSLPSSGTLQAVSSTTTHVGGCASNAAMDLAILGVPVGLSCKVGKDSFGEFVVSEQGSKGVDVSGIIMDEECNTTSSIVLVSSKGERSFLYNSGSTGAFTKEDISNELVDAYDIIFVGGAMLLTSFDGEPCAHLFKEAKAKGKMTVMDTAWDFEDRWLEKIEAVFPHLDLFMPSVEEAQKLSGKIELDDIADFFFDKGVKSVIIKTGKDGAYLCPTREERFSIPTYSKIKPVDTTGAGDSFCAGFLCGIAQGWDYKKSGIFANAVGTHCIMKIGASSGIKPIADILEFIENNEIG